MKNSNIKIVAAPQGIATNIENLGSEITDANLSTAEKKEVADSLKQLMDKVENFKQEIKN